jgi:excisionase family DNA binding protein
VGGGSQGSPPVAPISRPFAATLLPGKAGATAGAAGTDVGAGAGLYVVPGGEKSLLTVREVATRLNVCTATVYRLCARGLLRHVRILNAIRVRPTDLRDLVEGVPADTPE